VALRRFRFPIPIRVRVENGAPARVTIYRGGVQGGPVTMSAGPWRTSGAWWIDDEPGQAGASGGRSRSDTPPWDRDEWDVMVADGTTYRLFHDRSHDAWFLDGVVD
jgi:hypothetical protein